MIFEERHTTLRQSVQSEGQKVLTDWLQLCERDSWPAIQAQGGSVLCLLNGTMGAPQNQLLQIARFPDFDEWQAAQEGNPPGGGNLVEREEVRLMKQVSSRPKPEVPEVDRRAVYGYRRFLINPADLEEFVHCSERGHWDRIESEGVCILGQWATVAATTPLEVVLLTGYHGPAHWEASRGARPRPEDADQELWDRSSRLSLRRNELTLWTTVTLMRTLFPEPPVRPSFGLVYT
jgi:hypothetical protein